jgi:NAD+ synthase (glutamine-hydrolysing)
MGDVDVPFGPGLLFTATDMPVFVLHVEICVDMFVPLPPSAQAALAGATVLTRQPRSRSDVPRTAARRPASSRCLAGYVYEAASEGESTTDLAWGGRTMIWEKGVCLAQSERFTQGERRSIAGAGLDLLRSEWPRMGTFDDNRRHHRITEDSFRRVESALDPPAGDIGLLSRSSGFRLCQRIPHGCNTIATRRTTSRSPVSSSGRAR